MLQIYIAQILCRPSEDPSDVVVVFWDCNINWIGLKCCELSIACSHREYCADSHSSYRYLTFDFSLPPNRATSYIITLRAESSCRISPWCYKVCRKSLEAITPVSPWMWRGRAPVTLWHFECAVSDLVFGTKGREGPEAEKMPHFVLRNLLCCRVLDLQECPAVLELHSIRRNNAWFAPSTGVQIILCSKKVIDFCLIDSADAPVCANEQEGLLGALKHETLMLKCEVDSSPPATSFHWTFNSSGEQTDLPTRLHSTSEVS